MGCSLSVLLKALLAGDSKWHEKKPEESYGGIRRVCIWKELGEKMGMNMTKIH